MEMDCAATPAAVPIHNFVATDLQVSIYFRHRLCQAILQKYSGMSPRPWSPGGPLELHVRKRYQHAIRSNAPNSDDLAVSELKHIDILHRAIVPLPSDGDLMFIVGRRMLLRLP